MPFHRSTLFEQVQQVLCERITGGIWPPNSMIPNEVEIAKELGVSVGTVRKALDNMVRDQLIVRKQGRGTFVKKSDQAALELKYRPLYDEAGSPFSWTVSASNTEVRLAETGERIALGASGPLLVFATAQVLECRGGRITQASVVPHALLENAQCRDFDRGTMSAFIKYRVHLSEAVDVLTWQHTELAGLTLASERTIETIDGNAAEWCVAEIQLPPNAKYVAPIARN